jgi:hypothetical protein
VALGRFKRLEDIYLDTFDWRRLQSITPSTDRLKHDQRTEELIASTIQQYGNL